MIHELLFNLWNNPSYSLEGGSQTSSHLFELPQFLHPGEERLLQIITEIATEYHKIVDFTESVLGLTSQEVPSPLQKSVSIKNGLYLKAFCNGARDVLSGYRKEIIKLEQTFLEHPQLSLTFILSCIDKYRGIFDLLQLIINKIQSETLHGCLIFNGLHKYNIHNTISIIDCGLDPIEEAADRLIKPINTVFYQHLCNWIIYGDLVDPYNEFFICDGKMDDENFAIAESSGSSTGLNMKSKIKKPPSIRKFFINWNLVPMFVTEDAAQSILFMGRIVWIFRNKPESVEKTNDYKTKFKKDIWEEKDVEYYSKIQDLANQTFNEAEFRKTLEECRIKLTKYLWSVMLEEGNLIEHLRLIRDYYALGRGELFQQFLSVSDSNLLDIPSEAILQHINIIFQETARKIYGVNDKTYSRFEFVSPTGEISRVNPWLKLQLNIEITWPLHIVFHPEVIRLYNKLFCYLLRLKKTQINLHRVWSNHILSRQKIDKRVFTLRQHLTFLVDNLQYYMQVNVIEAQFSILLKAVENANEFEDIIKVHHEFVTNLLAKTFVLSPNEDPLEDKKHCLYQIPALQDSVPSKVYNVVTKLLELCDEFCIVAGAWELELTEADLEELTALQKKTDIAIESLLFVLTSLHGKVKGGHLLQLLLHLDFNRYFLKGYFRKNQMDFNLTGALQVF